MHKEPAVVAADLLKAQAPAAGLSESSIQGFSLEFSPLESASIYDMSCRVVSDAYLHNCDWIGIYASSESADAEYLGYQYVRSYWGLRRRSFKIDFQCSDRQLIEGVLRCEARYFSWSGREFECIRRCVASHISSHNMLRPVFGSVF